MNKNKTDIKTVADIPDSFTLVQDSQDVQATLDYIGKLDRLPDAGCLFAEVLDGDYGDVYLCERYIPFLTATLEKIR
jgi:hypothetical protein